MPPVLLLHGFATSAARTWGENGWIDMLGDMGRKVIAPDLPGHGPGPHDPATFADLGAAVAAEVPDEPVDAIGFSLGARTLLGLAVDGRVRFRRLVVAGVGANLFRTEGSELIVQALRGGGDPANPVTAYFARLAQHPESDADALAAVMEARQPPLTAEGLGTLTCPTLVVLGDQDFAGPADPLVDAIPGSELVVLRNTDHFATPKSFTFMDKALAFLDR